VLQRNEYFKGVPIYVVQLRKSPLPVAQDLYYKGVNTMDSLYGRFIQFTDFIDGFGHNWGMQGALEDTMTNEKCSNYIFFSRTQAAEFAKNAGRKTARLRGSRTSNMQGIVKKPRIFVSNFEDFVELWEESLVGNNGGTNGSDINNLFAESNTFFVPTAADQQKVKEFAQAPKGFTYYSKILKQNLKFKYKTFTNFLGFFLSAP
jgi:hypothetical protein